VAKIIELAAMLESLVVSFGPKLETEEADIVA